jgi:hypothetical protein
MSSAKEVKGRRECVLGFGARPCCQGQSLLVRRFDRDSIVGGRWSLFAACQLVDGCLLCLPGPALMKAG